MLPLETTIFTGGGLLKTQDWKTSHHLQRHRELMY